MIFKDTVPPQNSPHSNSILGMYSSFAVLVFIVFGLAGTHSNWKGIQHYANKKAELNKVEQKVEERKRYLTQTEQELTKLSKQEKSINAMIPQGGDFEKYVEEVVAANTGYGFDVEKVSFTQPYTDNQAVANVSITFSTKDADPDLEGLVQSLEKTPRLSIIDRLSYTTISDRQTLKVDLTIYLVK
jgi:hypothetical protein